MQRTAEEMATIVARAFSHPTGWQSETLDPASGRHIVVKTSVEYQDPMPVIDDDLAGRLAGVLMLIASNLLAFKEEPPETVTSGKPGEDELSAERGIVGTTATGLLTCLDPSREIVHVEDIHWLLSALAGATIQVETTWSTGIPKGLQRFIMFSHFVAGVTRDRSVFTLNYEFSDPVWELAHL